jgi:hypothetical protein
MLTIPTVLVLGAGASVPYDFPTGATLSKEIVDALPPGRPFFNDLRKLGEFSEAELSDFRQMFMQSGRYSVDAFLEYSDKHLKIGKSAIALQLIKHERPERIYSFGNNWLRELYSRLNTPFEEFAKNKLSIVTFNYDRVVEHFFFSCLQSYGRSDEECKAVLDHIPIIRLHGRLGFLPWQGGDSRPFSPEITAEALKTSVANIKIIHEADPKPDDKDFNLARKLLADAEQVVLMGFGYNTKNVERLGIADIAAGKAFGTCQGLGRKGEEAAKQVCGGKVKLIGGDCMQFVRDLINVA